MEGESDMSPKAGGADEDGNDNQREKAWKNVVIGRLEEQNEGESRFRMIDIEKGYHIKDLF